MKKSDLAKFVQLVRNRKAAFAEAEKLRAEARELDDKAVELKRAGHAAWVEGATALGLVTIKFDAEGAVYYFSDGTMLTEKEVLSNGSD